MGIATCFGDTASSWGRVRTKECVDVTCTVLTLYSSSSECSDMAGLTFVGPCSANIFAEYNQQDTTFHNLFVSVGRATCFRWFFRPSSGAQNCTYRPILLPAASRPTRLAAGSSIGLYVQFWAPDDGWKNRLKHVARPTEIHKLWNVACCWLYWARTRLMLVCNCVYDIWWPHLRSLCWWCAAVCTTSDGHIYSTCGGVSVTYSSVVYITVRKHGAHCVCAPARMSCRTVTITPQRVYTDICLFPIRMPWWCVWTQHRNPDLQNWFLQLWSVGFESWLVHELS